MIRAAAVLVAFVFIAGCDSEAEVDSVPLGTFELRLSGADDVQFSGDATFIGPVAAPPAEIPLTIHLLNRTPSTPTDRDRGIQIQDPDGVLNRVGTYPLGPDADVEVTYVDLGGARGRVDPVAEGTLEITTLANDRIVGRIDAKLDTRGAALSDVLEVSFAAASAPDNALGED